MDDGFASWFERDELQETVLLHRREVIAPAEEVEHLAHALFGLRRTGDAQRACARWIRRAFARGDARFEDHQRQPAVVITVKVADQHGVDGAGVDAEAGHRHEGRHAAVDEVTPLRALNQYAGLKPSTAGERTTGAEELYA